MTTGRKNRSAHERRLQEACDWRNKHYTGKLPPADSEAWDLWKSVPENWARYEALTRLSAQLRQLPQSSTPSAAPLRDYLRENPTGKDTAIRRLARSSLRLSYRATTSMPALGMLAAAVTGALLLFSMNLDAPLTSQLPGRIYETAVGEQREFKLPDGSEVILQDETSLRTDFPGHPRTATLDYGRIIVQVKSDPTRPFVVYAAGGSISAVGTEFDVRNDPAGTNVFVAEGTVYVDPQADGIPGITGTAQQRKARAPVKHVPVRLNEGEQVRYTDGHTDPARRLNPDETPEPQWGLFSYNKRRLRDVVNDIQPYLRPREVTLDPSLDEVPYSGTVRKDSIESWLQELQHNQEAPMHIQEEPGQIVIGPRKDKDHVDS